MSAFIRWLADRIVARDHWRHRALAAEAEVERQRAVVRDSVTWVREIRDACTCGAVERTKR